MALELRSFSQVLKSFIESITNRTDKINDFNVGSVARTLGESISLQFEEFYFSMRQNLKWGIENSVYEAFDFSRKNAVAAYGELIISTGTALTNNVIIQSGETFSTGTEYGNVTFECTEDTLLESGFSTFTIPIECCTTGNIGNVPAYTITKIVSANNQIVACYNPRAFTNGTEYETQAERKARFKQYIATLGKGTAAAVEYGILTVEEVTGCKIDDRYIGYCIAYVHNSDGELPEDLKAKIQDTLIDYRSAGIEVQLLPVRIKEQNINLKVMIGDDYDETTYQNTINGLVTDYLNGFTTGEDLYMSTLIHIIKQAFEEQVINIKIMNGIDVRCDIMELIRPGVIKVTCVRQSDWSEV